MQAESHNCLILPQSLEGYHGIASHLLCVGADASAGQSLLIAGLIQR